ncbi:ion channel [Salinifilum ghardaiensis]
MQQFSFTTPTTPGHGDFTAATGPGRAVAALESLVGQIFPVTLVAWLVSAFRRRGSDPAAPSSPTTARFSTARIVLGWRSDR